MSLVKIQIMSDLHLETHPSYDFDFPQTAPNLGLLGDIGHAGCDGLFTFLERQLWRYKAVFYLFGNHEPFHLSMEVAKKQVQKFVSKMERLRVKSPSLGRFVFLEQTRYDLDEHVTILGCTLYSRITPEQARAVGSRMVDFRDILHWDVGEHVDAHLDDLNWLNAQVRDISCGEPQRRIVIFTHHSPCTDSRASNPRYKTSEVNSGFVTDLSEEVCWKSSSVVLWAFGHTHFNCDFCDDKGKRVLANQKGYFLFPQSTFRSGKTIEIGGNDAEASTQI